MNLTSTKVSMFSLVKINEELFWMNNKPIIIEFGFRIIWRITKIEESVIRLGVNTFPDLHDSSDDT